MSKNPFFLSPERLNVQEISEREEPLISVVMPAYNEREHVAGAIRSVVKQLEGLGYNYEIVVIDDGSTDGTFNVIKKLELMNFKVFRFSKNQGKGFALRYGLNLTNGDLIFFLEEDVDKPFIVVRPRKIVPVMGPPALLPV